MTNSLHFNNQKDPITESLFKLPQLMLIKRFQRKTLSLPLNTQLSVLEDQNNFQQVKCILKYLKNQLSVSRDKQIERFQPISIQNLPSNIVHNFLKQADKAGQKRGKVKHSYQKFVQQEEPIIIGQYKKEVDLILSTQFSLGNL